MTTIEELEKKIAELEKELSVIKEILEIEE